MTESDADSRRPNRRIVAPIETIPPLADEMAEWSRIIRAVPVDPRNQSGGGAQIMARMSGRAIAIQRRETAVAAINANPDGRSADIAWSCGLSQTYINDVRKSLRKEGAL